MADKMLSVRIVTADTYMAEPIPDLDITFSEFRGCEIKRVPIVRVFGATTAGQKTCLHIHGLLPYIYVPYDGPQPADGQYLLQFAISIDKALQVAMNQPVNHTLHVYKITLVAGIPFYGYHEQEKLFMKIYFCNPMMVKKAVDLLHGGAIMNKIHQPHEAHIPFLLQFFIDYNLSGMDLINISAFKFRNSDAIHANSQPFDETGSSFYSNHGDKPSQAYYNVNEVPRSQLVGVARQSTCEFEVDCVAVDILNRLQIQKNVGRNPGLMAIWEDEKKRREELNQMSQLLPPSSLERGLILPTESERLQLARLEEIIQQQSVLIASGTDDENGDMSLDSSQGTLQLHSQSGDSLLHSPTQSQESFSRNEVEPCINEEAVLSVVEASQSFSMSQQLGATQDKRLVELLADLANENNLEDDSILSGLSQKEEKTVNEQEISEEEEEEILMSQAWNETTIEMTQTSINAIGTDDMDIHLSWLNDTFDESSGDKDANRIPQVDGGSDEKQDPVITLSKKYIPKRIKTLGARRRYIPLQCNQTKVKCRESTTFKGAEGEVPVKIENCNQPISDVQLCRPIEKGENELEVNRGQLDDSKIKYSIEEKCELKNNIPEINVERIKVLTKVKNMKETVREVAGQQNRYEDSDNLEDSIEARESGQQNHKDSDNLEDSIEARESGQQNHHKDSDNLKDSVEARESGQQNHHKDSDNLEDSVEARESGQQNHHKDSDNLEDSVEARESGQQNHHKDSDNLEDSVEARESGQQNHHKDSDNLEDSVKARESGQQNHHKDSDNLEDSVEARESGQQNHHKDSDNLEDSVEARESGQQNHHKGSDNLEGFVEARESELENNKSHKQVSSQNSQNISTTIVSDNSILVQVEHNSSNVSDKSYAQNTGCNIPQNVEQADKLSTLVDEFCQSGMPTTTQQLSNCALKKTKSVVTEPNHLLKKNDFDLMDHENSFSNNDRNCRHRHDNAVIDFHISNLNISDEEFKEEKSGFKRKRKSMKPIVKKRSNNIVNRYRNSTRIFCKDQLFELRKKTYLSENDDHDDNDDFKMNQNRKQAKIVKNFHLDGNPFSGCRTLKVVVNKVSADRQTVTLTRKFINDVEKQLKEIKMLGSEKQKENLKGFADSTSPKRRYACKKSLKKKLKPSLVFLGNDHPVNKMKYSKNVSHSSKRKDVMEPHTKTGFVLEESPTDGKVFKNSHTNPRVGIKFLKRDGSLIVQDINFCEKSLPEDGKLNVKGVSNISSLSGDFTDDKVTTFSEQMFDTINTDCDMQYDDVLMSLAYYSPIQPDHCSSPPRCWSPTFTFDSQNLNAVTLDDIKTKRTDFDDTNVKVHEECIAKENLPPDNEIAADLNIMKQIHPVDKYTIFKDNQQSSEKKTQCDNLNVISSDTSGKNLVDCIDAQNVQPCSLNATDSIQQVLCDIPNRSQSNQQVNSASTPNSHESENDNQMGFHAATVNDQVPVTHNQLSNASNSSSEKKAIDICPAATQLNSLFLKSSNLYHQHSSIILPPPLINSPIENFNKLCTPFNPQLPSVMECLHSPPAHTATNLNNLNEIIHPVPVATKRGLEPKVSKQIDKPISRSPFDIPSNSRNCNLQPPSTGNITTTEGNATLLACSSEFGKIWIPNASWNSEDIRKSNKQAIDRQILSNSINHDYNKEMANTQGHTILPMSTLDSRVCKQPVKIKTNVVTRKKRKNLKEASGDNIHINKKKHRKIEKQCHNDQLKSPINIPNNHEFDHEMESLASSNEMSSLPVLKNLLSTGHHHNEVNATETTSFLELFRKAIRAQNDNIETEETVMEELRMQENPKKTKNVLISLDTVVKKTSNVVLHVNTDVSNPDTVLENAPEAVLHTVDSAHQTISDVDLKLSSHATLSNTTECEHLNLDAIMNNTESALRIPPEFALEKTSDDTLQKTAVVVLQKLSEGTLIQNHAGIPEFQVDGLETKSDSCEITLHSTENSNENFPVNHSCTGPHVFGLNQQSQTCLVDNKNNLEHNSPHASDYIEPSQNTGHVLDNSQNLSESMYSTSDSNEETSYQLLDSQGYLLEGTCVKTDKITSPPQSPKISQTGSPNSSKDMSFNPYDGSIPSSLNQFSDSSISTDHPEGFNKSESENMPTHPSLNGHLPENRNSQDVLCQKSISDIFCTDMNTTECELSHEVSAGQHSLDDCMDHEKQMVVGTDVNISQTCSKMSAEDNKETSINSFELKDLSMDESDSKPESNKQIFHDDTHQHRTNDDLKTDVNKHDAIGNEESTVNGEDISFSELPGDNGQHSSIYSVPNTPDLPEFLSNNSFSEVIIPDTPETVTTTPFADCKSSPEHHKAVEYERNPSSQDLMDDVQKSPERNLPPQYLDASNDYKASQQQLEVEEYQRNPSEHELMDDVSKFPQTETHLDASFNDAPSNDYKASQQQLEVEEYRRNPSEHELMEDVSKFPQTETHLDASSNDAPSNDYKASQQQLGVEEYQRNPSEYDLMDDVSKSPQRETHLDVSSNDALSNDVTVMSVISIPNTSCLKSDGSTENEQPDGETQNKEQDSEMKDKEQSSEVSENQPNNDQPSLSTIGLLAAFKVWMPQENPPSRATVTESLEKYGLKEFYHQEAFCRIPDDLPDKSSNLPSHHNRIKSLVASEFPKFKSTISDNGIQHWRKSLVHSFSDTPIQCADDSFQLVNEIENRPEMRALTSGNKSITITPCKIPLSRSEVVKWMKEKELHRQAKRRKLEMAETKDYVSIKNVNVQTKEDKLKLIDQNMSERQCVGFGETSCLSTGQLNSNTVNSLISMKPETKLLQNQPQHSTPLRETSTLHSTAFTQIGSSSTPHQGSCTLINRTSTPQRSVSGSFQITQCTPILKVKEPSTINKIELENPKLDPLNLEGFATPVARTASDLSEIDGPTPKNTYGFKVSQHNLKDAKSVHEVQHITVMSLEVHCRCRLNYRPDPEADTIFAIFYCIQSDTAGTETGVITLDPNIGNDGNTEKRSFLAKAGIANLKEQVVGSEQAIFEEIVKVVKRFDPDILVGYEIQMLSWGYLIQRAEFLAVDILSQLSRIPDAKQSKFATQKDEWGADHMSEISIVGRIVLNLWRLMRHEVALTNYRFENVAFHVLHQRVPEYSFRCLSDWFDHRTDLYRWRTIEHYVIRVEGSMKLLNQLDLIGRTSELARVFGIQFYSVLSRGSQYRVESMMLRLAKPMNYIAVSPSVQQRARMNAPVCIPLVMEPESRFYQDPVIVLDFQSLYPSMMMAYNYCYSTCLGKIEGLAENGEFKFGCTSYSIPHKKLKKLFNKNDIHVSPNGVAFVKSHIRRGVLPRMVEEILEARVMVKKAMKDHKGNKVLTRVLDSRQLGLKLIANVTYGYTSASFSGRMPCVEIGDSIVRKARETLERAIHLVENSDRWDAQVVYGDTDSLFILVKGASKEHAFKMGKEMVDAVTADNPKPVKLKFEKVYHPCVLQSKKRYVGYSYESLDQKEPIFDAKGIETVRRDSCPAVGKILERSIKVLFNTHDISEVKSYVKRQCNKVLEGRISMHDLIFAKEYRGKNSYRPGACVPALELAKRMLSSDRRSEPRTGERVPYVIVYGSPGLPLIQLVRSPLEVIKNPSQRLNAIYYVTKQILPPLDRIMSLFGVDVFQWYNELPKVVKLAPPLALASENKQGTISQYFNTMNCEICDQLTKTGICANCRKNPQDVATTLSYRIHDIEKNYTVIKTICNSCQGFSDEKQVCLSLDCPVMFKLSKATLELNRLDGLHRILSNST